ncbi:glycosyltransferase family 8 protein [Yoonia sp.]|uniref:glycosyltransferase family 8 protein n=1 Tax=Yoonia sp. TaxID=2212373 RepID=UPI003918F77E
MTQIRVVAENRPAKSRHAVVFCCDANYLPYAALAIHTLLRNNPVRDYDICITSLDELTIPPALEGHDIRMCQIDVGDAFATIPTPRKLSMTAYLRLVLAEAFSSEYSRVFYLDCDVFVVGEAINDAFAINLGECPVGACRDSAKWKKPYRDTKDQSEAGFHGNYFNSGALLIDTQKFLDQDIRAACIQASNQVAHKLSMLDQPILNIALKDNWMELHPAWNWQWVAVRPMFDMFINVQILHFIGSSKPWSDQKDSVPVRYREIARRFMDMYYPHLSQNIGEPAKRLSKRAMVFRILKHLTRTFKFVDGYNRHGGDIMKVLPPK